MNQDRSVDERIGVWLLEEAPSQLPDRVLQATFARTSVSRQRGHLLKWSFPTRTHRWVLIVLALIIAFAATLLAIGARLPQLRSPEVGRNGLIAFDADWQIHVMNSDGTGRRQISSGPNDFWPIWSPDGTRLVFHRTPTRTGLSARTAVSYWIARADGSGATNITNGQTLYKTLRWVPSWSPDSDSIVFASGSLVDSALYVAPTDGSGPRQIVDETLQPSTPRWSPTGATIAFKGGRTDNDRGIYLVNPDGSGLRKLTTNPPRFRPETVPLWSPDGRRLLFSAGDPGAEDLWLLDADGGQLRRLTDTPFGIDEAEPAWSPDGTKIAFQRFDHSAHSAAVYVIDADGSDPIRVSADTPIGQPLVWSPDGNHVLTTVCSPSCNGGLEAPVVLILDPRGREPPQRLANEPAVGDVLSWQRLAPIPAP